MTTTQAQELVQKLQEQGVEFVAGLTNEEITQVEQQFGFTFPPDLKQFLQTALPVSGKFYDWRKALTDKEVADHVREMLYWPLEGILYDIEENKFWYQPWGPRPELMEEQKRIATQKIAAYPVLIPVVSHRYIPATPHAAGSPVFSAYQTDIICYGNNLAQYFSEEFFIELSDSFTRVEAPVTIEFWTDLVHLNG